MRRRDFLTILTVLSVARPFAAKAQQSRPGRRVSILLLNSETDPAGQARVTAFRESLRELGWTDGRNLHIDYRWGAGAPDRARELAAEQVKMAPDVIVANGTAALAALHEATRSIPVVFVVVTDPVGAGYVQSLGRPGGNITGFSTFEPEIGGKWLQLLLEISPKLRRIGGILDPGFTGFAAIWAAIESMASTRGLDVAKLTFRQPADDLETAVAAFAQAPSGCLIVLPTAINNLHRDRIIALAARHRLPAIYPFALYAASGGLVSYGIDSVDLFRRSASYVDRILRGENPADLPVQAPTRYELTVNLGTARALGIDIPPTLLARADEVIE